MKLKAIVPMLAVRSVDETIAWYQKHLGMDSVNRTEGWACLDRDGVELMIALPNKHEPFEKPTFTGSLYFQCDEVDALWESLKDKAEVVYPIEDFDYGMREFAVRDNSGYILQFGKEIQ